ncbi:MAG: DUF349 domain-containing protein [Marinifilaceae bacterium]
MESKELNSMKEEEQTNATTSENVQENIEIQDSTTTEETKKVEEINFSELSKEDIVSELQKLVNNNHVNDIKQLFEEGLTAYNSLHEADFNKAKTIFVSSGEKEENFSFRDASKENMDLIEKTFRTKKHEFYKSQEDRKDFNLKAKRDIIEEIKNLVNNQESMNDTFNQFKELQRKWHEVGMVPQAELKNLWELYHHHVENFYDYIKINKELRDLDLKKNMDLKIALCVKAENLESLDFSLEVSKSLQELHEDWREIGPVPKDDKEELWSRFKKVTELINKKNHDFYTQLKDEQKENLTIKETLCEKAESISDNIYESHKQWNDNTNIILELQKLWQASGAAPKKDRNRVYKRFRTSCDIFYEKKKEYYFNLKDIQNNNLVLKEKLCEKAEEMKEQTDWKSTTDKFIALQKDWKNIGPVSKKLSDKLWARFRAACDAFFESKEKHFSTVDQEFEGNLKLKEDLIIELETFEACEKEEDTINKLTEIQNRWVEIGFVPFKAKNVINDKFQNLLNAEFDKLDLDSVELNVQRFKAKIDSYFHGDKSERKILHEREKLVSKIKESISEAATLENNMGFLSASSKGSGIIKDLEDKILKAKDKVKLLRAKLKVIDDLL